MAVPKFEYFPTRAAFDTARGATTVFNNSVVFIEDTMELFTHGHFWTVSNLSQYYNSSTQKLQLKNGSTVISELDASPFVKDGMLESVELITTPEGSSAVLSVNGTNYPIVELDATDFNSIAYTGASDTDFTFKVIPTLDSNKAYIIKNANIVESNTTDYSFSNQGTFIVKFQPSDNLGRYTSIAIGHNDPDIYNYYQTEGTEFNEWLSIPATYQFNVTNWGGSDNDTTIPYYGTPYEDGGNSTITELTNATETTGSASNNDYPAVPYLKFTFNTFNGESTHTVIRVSIAELFTVYNGNNVLLSSNYAKASTYTEPAAGDKVDIAVGKLAKGVADNAAAIATKQATITGAATSITTNNLTASKALVSDANGKVAVSNVTSTELGYLSGVTSNIQTQLNAKANIADLGWVEH
jgi:hypothetical protein